MGFKGKLSLFIVLFSILSLAVSAQVRDWDDVSKRELQMEYYSPDSSASAVVLFDKAEVDLNQNLEYVMERHVRIKILREEGYKWAEAAITYNDELDQDVNRIRGHTFTLDPKGKIKKHKLDGDSIFEEDLFRGYKQVKFTLPALEPGAVLEYKYRKEIGSPYLLPDWEFQRSIPVAWSEYEVTIPEWFFYNKMFVGNHPLHIQEIEPYSDRIRYTIKQRSGWITRRTDYRNAFLDISGKVNRWVMKDLPAVTKLPYMTSTDDYIAKLWLQLTEIRIPGQTNRYFLKTWKSVAEEILELDSFGGQLKSEAKYRNLVSEITGEISDPHIKMQAIFNYVQHTMVWDNTYSIVSENELDDVLNAQKGSSGELNLLLVQLLREGGLNADPVLLSTRNHGKVFEQFAIANQFNHVIAAVTIDEKYFLLDATSDHTSPNFLPVQDLNGNGLAIGNGEVRWVPLKPMSDTRSRITFSATLNEDGTIKGKVYVDKTGYDAAAADLKMKGNPDESYMNNILQDHFNAGKVDSFQIAEKPSESGKLSYSLFISGVEPKERQSSADMIYLNPVMFLRENENPFSQPERKIPVEFPHPFEKEFIANYVIPEGYKIIEVPESRITSIPGGALEIRRLTQVNQNRITYVSKFSLKKTTFKPEEYKYLRGFYSYMIDLHNKPIVLKAVSTE